MVKAGIIGATGYAGGELARLLMGHGEVQVKWYGSVSHVDKKYCSMFQNFFEIIPDICVNGNIHELADMVDVIFAATPQGYCSSFISRAILSKCRIVDLSADFRIKDLKTYEKWYNLKHSNPDVIKDAVYGLSEINREKIKNTFLVANPGCYPTCTILSLYPLLKENLVDTDSIIVDAKSGASGAGRGARTDNLFCETNENIKAYGVTDHRHTPEIEEQLSYAAGKNLLINFTPHLVPMNRGILTTSYAKLKRELSYDEARHVYEKYYRDESFIRLLNKDAFPQTKWVEGSNYVDINFKIDKRTNRIVVMGAMDNLVKGAAGQAVQNMNLMFGIKEETGLMQIPMFP